MPERSDPARSEITRILHSLSEGGPAEAPATQRLFALIYDELHAIADAYMHRERSGHTLQPTALVHEAYLKLVEGPSVAWQGRSHFLGIAARAMRQILVDHARRKGAAKRGGGFERVTLDESDLAGGGGALDLLDLDEALRRFAALDDRAARVVEMRVFGGMTAAESAGVLGVSSRTVEHDWSVARLWLGRELLGGSNP
ncbi:MAG TPA: ECF-type sigma factor [Candidatus Eisenbacteria bacterium]|nr:ECF-type sigma factor [Candidatus Eisenbacteria bacterium]